MSAVIAAVAARIIVSAVLFVSSIAKFLDVDGFAAITVTYDTVPVALSGLVRRLAYLIPFFELVAAFFIAFPTQPFTVYAYYLAGLLFAGFTVLLSVELLQGGKKENCGCFGTAYAVELSWKEVFRDLVFLSLVVFLIATV